MVPPPRGPRRRRTASVRPCVVHRASLFPVTARGGDARGRDADELTSTQRAPPFPLNRIKRWVDKVRCPRSVL